EELQKKIINQGILWSKCVVNPAYSIDFSSLRHDLDKSAEIFFKMHSPIISCVGMYEPQYGFDTAISCLSLLKEKFPKIGFFFVCSGGGTQKERLLSQAEQAELSKHIIFLEDVPHKQCLTIIGKSDLFIRPTIYDGDAISVREAIALGVPVVASNTSFRPSSIVTFEIGDARGMAKAIIETLCDIRKRSEFSSTVSSEKYLEEILKIYSGACKPL
ncbi:MAG: glycosyltransferase, partial [Candidatus Heimdallarchaeota archaeon]|nr:glycosyltransferase [Candidatus Heimdallarchaeota archaeon]